MPLEDGLVQSFLQRVRKEEPSGEWFDDIQTKVAEVLGREARFYPGFKVSSV